MRLSNGPPQLTTASLGGPVTDHSDEGSASFATAIVPQAQPIRGLVSVVRNRISAGTLPEAKSTKKCPPESAIVDRRWMPSLTPPG